MATKADVFVSQAARINSYIIRSLEFKMLRMWAQGIEAAKSQKMLIMRPCPPCQKFQIKQPIGKIPALCPILATIYPLNQTEHL